MKPRKILTGAEEHEIAKRIALRRAYSTKNLMCEFNASRSVIDRIARESEMLVPNETIDEILTPCAR